MTIREKIIMNIKVIIKAIKRQIRLYKNEMMVIRICKEEGLNEEQTKLIKAVIRCESGFDDKAINRNSDNSIDYGIIQANSFWYIYKMKLLTKDEALNDPEKCVRIMIDRYKKGRLNDWVCFKKGLYKQFT